MLLLTQLQHLKLCNLQVELAVLVLGIPEAVMREDIHMQPGDIPCTHVLAGPATAHATT